MFKKYAKLLVDELDGDTTILDFYKKSKVKLEQLTDKRDEVQNKIDINSSSKGLDDYEQLYKKFNNPKYKFKKEDFNVIRDAVCTIVDEIIIDSYKNANNQVCFDLKMTYNYIDTSRNVVVWSTKRPLNKWHVIIKIDDVNAELLSDDMISFLQAIGSDLDGNIIESSFETITVTKDEMYKFN